MSTKLKIALVVVAMGVAACAQQEEPVVVLDVQPEPVSSKY
ncbi:MULTISPECIES: hypothetical protein [Neptunicoccus]|uniref:Uncharacterized protein n=1 Tax=Neptunicoccus cionae TaxID=2035344 RepID=A0A916QSZ3_9RHOB|nr:MULTISPECIES: hypothetical protein [Paracoccaceae]GGA09473.1 hypothetical protein GCM10011498_06790 [Amylibacter cionae]